MSNWAHQLESRAQVVLESFGLWVFCDVFPFNAPCFILVWPKRPSRIRVLVSWASSFYFSGIGGKSEILIRLLFLYSNCASSLKTIRAFGSWLIFLVFLIKTIKIFLISLVSWIFNSFLIGFFKFLIFRVHT